LLFVLFLKLKNDQLGFYLGALLLQLEVLHHVIGGILRRGGEHFLLSLLSVLDTQIAIQ
jgi:hypothetical protein